MVTREEKRALAPYMRLFPMNYEQAGEILDNPKVPIQIFEVLWEQKPTSGTAELLSNSIRCPATLIVKWICEMDKSALSWHLLGCPQLPPEFLDYEYTLRSKSSRTELERLLLNPSLPTTAMQTAIADGWGSLLVERKNLSDEIRDELFQAFKEPDQSWLRETLASSSITPIERLREIFELDHSVIVKSALACNPALPNDLARELCLDDHAAVLRGIRANFFLPYEYSRLAVRKMTACGMSQPIEKLVNDVHFTWRETLVGLEDEINLWQSKGGGDFQKWLFSKDKLPDKKRKGVLFRKTGEEKWTFVVDVPKKRPISGRMAIPETVSSELFLTEHPEGGISVKGIYSEMDGEYHGWECRGEGRAGIIKPDFPLTPVFPAGPNWEEIHVLGQIMDGECLLALWGNGNDEPRGWSVATDGSKVGMEPRKHGIFVVDPLILNTLKGIEQFIRTKGEKELTL